MLVDAGFGLRDCADPSRIRPTRYVIRPRLHPTLRQRRQIKSMGLRTEDVRHIVVTHFDMDHIGGIADFPRYLDSRHRGWGLRCDAQPLAGRA